MTDALSGSEIAAIRDRRHRDRAEARGERLAARRAEILTPEFLTAALTSKGGIKHVYAAVHLHARGQVGGLTTRQLATALEQLLSEKGK
jgi:hypothetical protein